MARLKLSLGGKPASPALLATSAAGAAAPDRLPSLGVDAGVLEEARLSARLLHAKQDLKRARSVLESEAKRGRAAPERVYSIHLKMGDA